MHFHVNTFVLDFYFLNKMINNKLFAFFLVKRNVNFEHKKVTGGQEIKSFFNQEIKLFCQL